MATSNKWIKDARGKPVAQLDPVALHVLHRYDQIEAEALHEIVETLEPGTARLRRYTILMIPGVLACMAALIAVLYYTGDASARSDLISTITNPAIMVPNLVCCILIPWMTTRQARLKRVRFALLQHLRCPHCGYDLRGLPVTPEDGATVCPECGCAWLLEDEAIAAGLAADAPAVGLQGKRGALIAVLILGGLALLGLLMFRAMS